MSDARAIIKQAMIDQHQSVTKCAEKLGVHATNVYGFLRGGRLEEGNAGRLRALLPGLPAEVWADAFAPLPEPITEASAEVGA